MQSLPVRIHLPAASRRERLCGLARQIAVQLLPCALWLILLLAPHARAAQAVLQRGYDAGNTGANLSELQLTAANVGPASFGRLYTLPVDDTVFAQPLYVPNVTIPGQGVHNVVYIATMNDSVYAFDADAGGAALWQANLATRVGATPVPITKFAFSGNLNIIGNLGILATPVIDPATNMLYAVAATLEGGTIAYRLHALDIATGAEPYGPGTLISGTYKGNAFNGRYQTQRVSLALAGNAVVFGFGAVELEYPGGYGGWVMAYDKKSLQQTGAFAAVTTGNHGGGIWQSGRSPAVDAAGFVYVFTGNGYGGYDGVDNFGESVLKLNPANGLALVDWFTPGNWSTLDSQDLDVTSSGPLLIPGTTLLTGGGKTGDLYLLNTANLGKYNATDSQVVQKESIALSEIRGGPVYWQRSAANGGPVIFNWGIDDTAKAYAFNGAQFATSPSSVGLTSSIFPGGLLALSANGDQHGSGVLWATTAASGDAENNPPVPGILHAYNAENLASELWNSTMNPTQDGLGNLAKFVPPLVANGKVYLATSSNQIAVYGLLPTPGATGLAGSYFNNLTLGGTPALTRTEAVDFDWGLGSPGPGVASDNFSVRWLGTLQPPSSGNYVFQTLSDDGVRLWINGVLVIDNWTPHPPTTNTSAAIALTAGVRYAVRMEYFDSGLGAVARLRWQPPGATGFVAVPQAQLAPARVLPAPTPLGTGLTGTYFNNPTLSGSPVLTRVEAVDFNWGTGSPAASVNADQFSARWQGAVLAPVTGAYTFQTISDDGIRLWVNGVLVVDNWTPHPATTNTTGVINLAGGQSYAIKVEYFEATGLATARLQWQTPTTAMASIPAASLYPGATVPTTGNTGTGLTGTYFANATLSGSPVLVRNDVVDFDWGTGSPGPDMPTDNFSVRWTGTVLAPATGNYDFQTLSDDGIRVWINGVLVIDNWTNHAAFTNTTATPIALVAGQRYAVRIEYYEALVDAVARWRWRVPGTTIFTPVPASQLFPG